MPASSTLSMFLTGVSLGLGAAVPIGPVNVEMARRALSWGWRTAVALGLGAVTVDCVYAVVASLGVQIAAESVWVSVGLGLVGIAFLGWLGVGALLAAWREYRMHRGTDWAAGGETGARPPVGRSYVTGLGMTLTNPMTLVFWFLGLPGTAGAAVREAGSAGLVWVLALGVTLGAAAWAVTWCTILTGLGRYRRPWWVAATNAVGGVTLLVIAGVSLTRIKFH